MRCFYGMASRSVAVREETRGLPAETRRARRRKRAHVRAPAGHTPSGSVPQAMCPADNRELAPKLVPLWEHLGLACRSYPKVMPGHRKLPLLNNLAQVLVQRGFNLFAGYVTHNLFLDLPVLENKQGGDAPNPIALGRNGIAVHIHFADLHFAGVGSSNFVHDGRKHLTRTAPDRPEINQYRLIALQNCLIKVSVGD